MLLSLAGSPTAAERETPSVLEARLLRGLASFALEGTMLERLDLERGRFEVRATGRGHEIENVLVSSGTLIGGQWTPETTDLSLVLWGRTCHTRIQFDWPGRVVRLHSRGESVFLRSPRAVDATLVLEPDVHIDDLGSITVNYADGRWPRDPDGKRRTYLVGRSADPGGGSDGPPAYRAELRPLVLEARLPDERGRVLARVDITGFTSWARPDKPARIIFGPDGRLERVDLRLRFGTSVRVRFGDR